MTIEEVILYLKRTDMTVGREIKTKTAEALEMAIKALEQKDVVDKIRAEIEQKAIDYDKFDDYRRTRGLWIALGIIDKYKAESEEEDDYGISN